MTELVRYSPVGSPMPECILSDIGHYSVSDNKSSQSIINSYDFSNMSPLECFEYLDGLSEEPSSAPISNR